MGILWGHHRVKLPPSITRRVPRAQVSRVLGPDVEILLRRDAEADLSGLGPDHWPLVTTAPSARPALLSPRPMLSWSQLSRQQRLSNKNELSQSQAIRNKAGIHGINESLTIAIIRCNDQNITRCCGQKESDLKGHDEQLEIAFELRAFLAGHDAVCSVWWLLILMWSDTEVWPAMMLRSTEPHSPGGGSSLMHLTLNRYSFNGIIFTYCQSSLSTKTYFKDQKKSQIVAINFVMAKQGN